MALVCLLVVAGLPHSWLLPVPRWVLVEAVSATCALRSLPPPLPLVCVVAVGHKSYLPAIHQVLAVHLLPSTLVPRSVHWQFHPALLPVLGAPELPLRQPL